MTAFDLLTVLDNHAGAALVAASFAFMAVSYLLVERGNKRRMAVPWDRTDQFACGQRALRRTSSSSGQPLRAAESMPVEAPPSHGPRPHSRRRSFCGPRPS